MTSRTSKIKVTIASSATISSQIIIPNGSVVGVQFPATMTGTSVSFKSANNEDDTKLSHYSKAGALLTVPFTASTITQVDANDTSAMGHFVQVVSNDTEAAERTLYIIVRDLS